MSVDIVNFYTKKKLQPSAEAESSGYPPG